MEGVTNWFNLSARNVPKFDGTNPGGLSYEVDLIYLDDIIIFQKSFEEHFFVV